MSDNRTEVINQIREAFRGVKLGNGVGLRQGRGLDDYADAKTLAKLRASDEKYDWSAMPAEDLNAFSSSLSFFDAEGMRFHLPAFMIADLEGKLHQNVVFHLTCLTPGSIEQFDILTLEQRRAIIAYLNFALRQADEEFARPRINRALSGYWRVDRD